MDVRNLAFDHSSFDVAIDKGMAWDKLIVRKLLAKISAIPGTMDAMLAVKGDVWVSSYLIEAKRSYFPVRTLLNQPSATVIRKPMK
jgi:hypothetical protein